jgi:CRISPR/Cas system-associated protein Csm6
MAKTIITPVGTSIFTNYMDKSKVVRDYPGLSRDYEAIDVQVGHLEDLPHEERNNSKYESDIKYIKERIKYLWLAEAKEKASAEIHTLAKIAEAETEQTKLEVHLLATDTVLSVVACELIQEWLKDTKVLKNCAIDCHFHINTHIVNGLQIKKADIFKTEGFQNLLILIQKYSKPKDKDTIINISGGYKAIVPFVTLFAQLGEIPLKYIYEDSDELITVGNLPFNFDFTFFTDEYVAFEDIKPGKDVKNLPSKTAFIKNLSSEDKYNQLEDALLIFEKENKIHLTELGKILYKRYETIDEDDGFDTANLLGKVMEIQVFEFFQKKFSTVVLGKPIGESKEGDAYDLDVFLETDDLIWAIEVKTQNVSVLMGEDMKEQKKKTTIEYKCREGAFKHAHEEYAQKQRNIAVFMYHHLEPNKFQIENFIKLQKYYDYIRWIWLKPPDNYKGNVNWSATCDKFKEFNFQSQKWEDFKL